MAQLDRDAIELSHPSPAASPPSSLSRQSSYSSQTTFDKTSRVPSLANLPALVAGVFSSPTAPGAGGRESPVEEPAVRLRRLSMGEEEDHEGEEGLEPVDGGRGAWMFVIAGFTLETFIWGFSYSFPSILVYLQTHDPWQSSSLAALSAIGTVLLAIQFMLPIAVITIFRRYPDWVKTMLWVSVFVNCASMLASSWATKVWQLILLQSVLGGLSGAVLYAPVLLWLNEWWHHRRGLASGIVFAGTGIGGLAFPFIISALLSRGGWALMTRVWAAITFAVYSISVWAIRPRVPPPKRRRGKSVERGPWSFGSLSFLKDPVVLVMTATTFVSSLSTFPATTFLATYTLALSTSHNSDLVVSIYNLSSSIGSLLTGWMSDVSLPLTVGVMGVAGGVLALTLWGYATNLGIVFAFAILFSFSTQICSAWGAAARDGAGANPHTSTLIFCTFGIVRGVASIVGPFISTVLYNPSVSAADPAWGRYGFSRVIVFVGVMSFVSAFGGAGLLWARRRKAGAKERERLCGFGRRDGGVLRGTVIE